MGGATGAYQGLRDAFAGVSCSRSEVAETDAVLDGVGSPPSSSPDRKGIKMSRAKVIQICAIVSLLLAAPALSAQESHKFFDSRNLMLWSGVAAAHAMDCDSTWKFLDSGAGVEEELPTSLARSRVQMTLFSVGVVGAQVGGSYLLHRMGWHRAERWSSTLHTTITGATAVHNYGIR
jgi:hypothetical protein